MREASVEYIDTSELHCIPNSGLLRERKRSFESTILFTLIGIVYGRGEEKQKPEPKPHIAGMLLAVYLFQGSDTKPGVLVQAYNLRDCGDSGRKTMSSSLAWATKQVQSQSGSFIKTLSQVLKQL